jgi:hypothetical protein
MAIEALLGFEEFSPQRPISTINIALESMLQQATAMGGILMFEQKIFTDTQKSDKNRSI